MSQNTPRKDDIRGQLSDIQRKLFGANKSRPRASDSSSRSSDSSSSFPGDITAFSSETGPNSTTSAPFPPFSASSGDRTTANAPHSAPHASLNQPSQLGPPPSNSAVLRRNNTPLQPATANHRGHRAVPQPNPALRPESKGQDMNFVVGLSENLLSECRRLTAENHNIKAKLKSQVDELNEYKTQVSTLAKTRSFAATSESHLRDKNWELETSNAALTEQLDALRSANEKLIRTHNENTLRVSKLQHDNDEHQMKAATLSSDLRLVQDTLQKRLAELNTRIEELNDENDTLHAKVLDLEAAKGLENTNTNDFVPHSQEDTVGVDDAENFDFEAVLRDSAKFLSEPALENPQRSDLQLETLQANLAHSVRTVSRLRAALMKAKNAPLASTRNTPKTARKAKHKDVGQSPGAGRALAFHTPAKRNSKFIILNDEEASPSVSQWPEEEHWENFLGADAGLTPSKSSKRVVDESDEEAVDQQIGSELKRTNSYLNDTDSSESDFEAPKKPTKQRVLSQELSRAAEPITEAQVQQFARDNNLVLLTSDDYAKLEHNDVSCMSVERITNVIENKGYVLLSKSEHAELLSEDEMRTRLLERGIVSLPEEDLAELKDTKHKHDNPEFAYLCDQLKVKGYEAVEEEYLASLQKNEALILSPPQSYLASKCKAANLHLLPNDEFKRLKRVETEYLQPSKEYLTKSANEMDLYLSSSDYIEELKLKANNPDALHVASKAEDLGLRVLSAEEFSRLQSPDLATLTEAAKKHSLILLKETKFKGLDELANNPSLTFLKSMSSKLGHLLLSNEDYQELTEPNLETLKFRALSLEHEILPSAEFARLEVLANNPPIDHIRKKAIGYDVTPEQEIKQLHKLAHEPSLSHVQRQAEKHSLVTLSQSEYTELYRQANEPSIKSLTAFAEKKNYKVVKVSDHERLSQIAKSPSIDFLKEKAGAAGCVVVPGETYKATVKLAHKPDEEHLRQKAKGLQLILIPEQELEKLKKCAENPDKNQLTEKAIILGLKVLTLAEHNSLVKRAHDPSIEEIRHHAEGAGYSVISTRELENIQKKATSPTLEELTNLAKNHQLILVDAGDYSSLQQSAKAPTLEHMRIVCERMGYTIIGREELSVLDQLAYKPNVEQLKERAEDLNLEVVPADEYSKLHLLAHAPSLEHVKACAKILNHVVVAREVFESIRGQAERPDVTHLTEKALERGMIVVPKASHETSQMLIASPPRDFIEKKAALHGFVLVERAKYDKPSLEFVTEKASLHNLVTINGAELEDLRTQLEAPSPEYIQIKADHLGLTVVSKSELRNLQLLANEPPESHVRDAATKLGLISLTESELLKLKNEAAAPS
ncbi:hypothetical protein OXX79_011977, partial [Metschnikowia pulcherrima]